MKITKRQLRELIREMMDHPEDNPGRFPGVYNPTGGREYDRGYKHALDNVPEDDSAGPEYLAGYEDGQHDVDTTGYGTPDIDDDLPPAGPAPTGYRGSR